MSFNERIWYRDCYTEIWREDCLVYYIVYMLYPSGKEMVIVSSSYLEDSLSSLHPTLHMTCQYIYVVWVSDIMTWDIFLSITDADMNLITQYNYLYLRCPLIKWCVFEVRPTNSFRLILYYEGSCTMYFVSCTFSI